LIFPTTYLFSQTNENSDEWYELQFEKADSLISEGLPRDVEPIYESIFERSKLEGNYLELLEVINKRMMNKCFFEENALNKVIGQLRGDIKQLTFPANQVAHSLLGSLYWNYYTSNRWRIHNRTSLASGITDDIETWDIRRIIQEVIAEIDLSMENPERLQNTPVDIFVGILNGDDDYRNLRPTVYDLLAHRAIGVFKNGEVDIIFPVEPFIIHDPVFYANSRQFASYSLVSPDSISLRYKTISLYQELTRYHLKINNHDALVDLELNRLKYVHSQSTHPLKHSLYRKALTDLSDKAINTEMKAEVMYRLAEFIYSLDRKGAVNYLLQSLAICEKVIKDYPNSEGSNYCKALSKKNHEPNIALQATYNVEPKNPFLVKITFANIDTAYFRLYKVNSKQFNSKSNNISIDTLQKWAVYRQWDQLIPKTTDCREHTVELPVNAIEAGFYIITASDNKDFITNSNISKSSINASTYFIVNKPSKKRNSAIFSITKGSTGIPDANVVVEIFSQHYDYKKRTYSYISNGKSTTNKNGNVSFTIKNNYYSLFASKNSDTLYVPSTYANNYYGRENSSTRTVLFTDRAIYRPGQTVYFKGLVLECSDQTCNIAPNEEDEIEFYDPNYQEIGSVEVVSNEFGTFNGSFVIPTGLLNGVFTLECYNGEQRIRVEEYKRPTFEVKISAPTKTYGYNDTIIVEAIAKAYAGYPIDNAKVQYRVTRQAESRWYWYYQPHEEKQVAVGKSITDKEGKFSVSYYTSDNDIHNKDLIYTYKLVVDITDANGETRSASNSIRISKTPLLISANLPEVYSAVSKPNAIIQTQNLNGEMVKAEMDICITELEVPKKILFNRPWSAPDLYALNETTFRKMFPYNVYRDETNPETWSNGKVMFAEKLNLSVNKFNLNESLAKLKAGYYRVNISAKDSTNKVATWTKVIRIIQEKPQMPQCVNDWVTPVKTSGEPGEQAEFWVTSLTPKTPIQYELLLGDSVIVSKSIIAKNKVEKIIIPIEERYRGGFAVQFAQVAHGQSFIFFQEVKVPFTNKKLDLSLTSFRNKLMPGELEQWQITVKNKLGEKENAEMLATLYDASLDAFIPHSWETEFYGTRNHSFNKWNDKCVPLLANTNYISRNGFSIWNWTKDYEYIDWHFDYNGGYNQVFHNYQKSLYDKKKKKEIGAGKADKIDENSISHEKMVTYNDSLMTSAGIAKENINTITVTGVVYSLNDGEPLPGVSIRIMGTTKGVVTDIDGKFTLDKIPIGAYIQVSFMGYRTKTLQVQSSTITINLDTEELQLEEVVVTALGINRESKSLGYANTVEFPEAEVAVESKINNAEIANIETRKNFNETAFFYPHLLTDSTGSVTINFTIPEALTRWKMMGFAHTKDFKTGIISNELITQKDVSIMVNAPRFLREADTIEFAAKVNNLSENTIEGIAQIQLIDPFTQKSLNNELLMSDAKVPFSIAKGQSTGIRWKLIIPSGVRAVTYKVIAKAGKFTDGEESTLPVLTNRQLITESLPFMLRPKQTREYRFDKMVDQKSTTLRNEAYTIEFTSNPVWYAIQAMPYLMEYPFECSEQVFSRFFANSISTTVMNSSPRIKAVFDTWAISSPEALVSNLEKNKELKDLLLQETPWLLNSNNEGERKRRIALLFDLNQMSNSINSAFNKLKAKQTPNGGFAWFDGMPDNRYITQVIATGIGQLKHLKAVQAVNTNDLNNMHNIAITYLDSRIVEDYKYLLDASKKGLLKLDDNHISTLQIHYLYSKSFTNQSAPSSDLQEAYSYFYKQAKTYWLSKDIYSQGMLSLVFNRSGDVDLAKKILKSLANRAQRSDELGMYWSQNNYGYYWYQAPIETQATLIEAFHEVTADTATVEELKIWLLRNKQTTDWKTTKATAAACYALLLRGVNLIDESKTLEVKIGNQLLNTLKDYSVEAGTGYVKTTFTSNEVNPAMGNIKVHNPNNGVAWGAAYWQYFEQLDKITSAKTNLQIDKKLFLKKHTNSGSVLIEITSQNPIRVGDEVVVRVEIRSDRDFEYVHLKDMRAAGFEPISTLSQYKYQDGLGYYESVKDASINFFMDYLRKGTYVFEYSLRAVHSGCFSNGITTMQSMYAPEFTTHSQGIRIVIKE
jgi:uncharacterized protein YfaS (alpha-2-macroglobulin family)